MGKRVVWISQGGESTTLLTEHLVKTLVIRAVPAIVYCGRVSTPVVYRYQTVVIVTLTACPRSPSLIPISLGADTKPFERLVHLPGYSQLVDLRR